MKKIIGGLILMVIMLPTIVLAAYPEDMEEQANYDGLIDLQELQTTSDPIDTSETIESDIYEMNQDVLINQTVDGNVYVMAQNAKIEDANIYGNVYIMAKKIEVINSEIEGSLYVMGEDITFSGMTNDVYACGSNIEFCEDSYVWRDAKIAGNTVKVNANIARNLYAGVKSLSVGDNAVIEGTLKYFSEEEGNISESARIADVQFEKEATEDTQKQESNVMKYIYEVLKVAFQAFILVLIVVFGVHKFKTLKRSNNITSDFLKDTGKGALVLIFVPIISILLMISIIGMGFGFVLLALYFILLYISIPVTALEITHRILAKQSENEIKKGKMIGISILISLIFWAIKFIPTIGGIIRFIAVLIGLGITATLIFQKNKKEEMNENEKRSN